LKVCSRALAALLLVGSLTACSGTVRSQAARPAEEVLTGLTVSGDPGTAPVVRMRTPLTIDETISAVTRLGHGAPIQVDQLFVLELTLYDARTGERALTLEPVAAKSSDDTLFPVLADALIGVREGSRVVVAATAADAFGSGGVPPKGISASDPVVVVADVVAVPPRTVVPSAVGTPVPHVPMTPEVVYGADDVPATVSFDHVTPVASLRSYPIVAGSGPRVRAHDVITVNYLAQRSLQDDPFEDTFFKEPVQVAIGTGTAPAAFDKFLVGVRRGSRVIIFGPAGRGMIAWVVDVLGVS
jgi:peptidylprolyl isomerase